MSMAKKKTKVAESEYHCRECKHSYDYHELNYKGDRFYANALSRNTASFWIQTVVNGLRKGRGYEAGDI